MKTTPMRTNESAAGSTRLLHRLTAALLALVLDSAFTALERSQLPQMRRA